MLTFIDEVKFALYGTDGKPSNGSAGIVLVKVLNRVWLLMFFIVTVFVKATRLKAP